jgi:uncharacterized delta-60 repeat protein
MALITRQSKGSKLSIAEMDGNLQYLEGLAQQGGGGGGSSYYDNGNSSQNTVIDWSRGDLQELGIDNNPTLSFTGAEAGQKLTLLLSREVGESRTITWSDGVFWRDGKTFDLKAVSGVALDEGFNIGDGVVEGVVFSLVLQSDGKILVGGFFTEFNGNSVNGLVRLNVDGSRDNGFNIGDGFNNDIRSIVLQPDGKILVSGRFTSFDGNSANGLVRLNTDGSRDTGFDIGSGIDGGEVISIVLQSDGKILVGGYFNSFDGNYSTNNLVRLNADGSLDTDFDIGDGFNNDVNTIVLQPDGRILVGGRFTSFDGNSANGLVRLNVDGSRDTGFGIGDGFDGDPIFPLVLQSDGKILVGGGFTSFDGNTANCLVRLDADGSLDTGFDIGNGFNGFVYTIALQSEGKILVGGEFSTFDGNYSNGGLVRLNTDGSLDTEFGIGSGLDGPKGIGIPLSIVLQPDGRILVGGFFFSFDGNPANNLMRLIELSGDAYTPVDLYYTGTRYIGDYSN